MGQNICGQMNAQNNQPISNMEDINDLDFNRNSTYKKLEQYSITVCKEKEIPYSYNMLVQRLLSMGQHPLFEHISKIHPQEKKNDFLRYLDSISHEMEVLDSLYHHFIKQSSEDQEEIVDIIRHIPNVQNVEGLSYEEYEKNYSTGLKLIRQKQVALVILAGGKNLRFDKDTSKYTSDLGLPSSQFMIDIIGKKLKTLKEIAFSNTPNGDQASFQIYIVVNQSNIFTVRNTWERNNFFGFNETDVCFTMQNMYPITDMGGKLQLRSESQCHHFPCGNGDILLQLIHKQYLNRLVDKGYKYIHFIGVENLLVKPLDPLFLGIAHKNKKSINQKCVKVDREESEFYRLASINGRASIIEYDSVKKFMKQNSSVKSKQINSNSNVSPDMDTAPAFLNNTLISINFLVEFSKSYELKHAFESKFRVMKRSIPSFQMNQMTPGAVNNITEENTNILIFEKQIGDILELTDDVHFIEVNSAEEFAPIIYKQGKYSPEDAVIKLSNLHKIWLRFEQKEVKDTDLIEVCPYVSYGGEGLDNYAEYLRYNWKSQQFPLYVNLRKINQLDSSIVGHDNHIGNGNQYAASFLANEEKKQENGSFLHSIDNLQNADQSFQGQRKETDLIHKSFSNLQGNLSNKQAPTSSKNIQQQIVLGDTNYKIPINNNIYIQQDFRMSGNENNANSQNNKNINSSQQITSQQKIKSTNELDQKSVNGNHKNGKKIM